MNVLIKQIEGLLTDTTQQGKSPLRHLGVFSCTNTVNIRHVPFYEPCLILVLTGKKIVFEKDRPVTCKAGDLIAVPGPASYDLRNEPDLAGKKYQALLIPFKSNLLEKLASSHTLLYEINKNAATPLVYSGDKVLIEAIQHYMTTGTDKKLLDHRLMEILLILTSRDKRLLSFGFNQTMWSARIRAILATDLSRPWNITEVCQQLSTSESKLRRNLKQESTNFREILYELRLTSALTQLLQTSQPVYMIAYNCGYQSVSRFVSNFHKRFGVPPKEFRISARTNDNNLAS